MPMGSLHAEPVYMQLAPSLQCPHYVLTIPEPTPAAHTYVLLTIGNYTWFTMFSIAMSRAFTVWLIFKFQGSWHGHRKELLLSWCLFMLVIQFPWGDAVQTVDTFIIIPFLPEVFSVCAFVCAHAPCIVITTDKGYLWTLTVGLMSRGGGGNKWEGNKGSKGCRGGLWVFMGLVMMIDGKGASVLFPCIGWCVTMWNTRHE